MDFVKSQLDRIQQQLSGLSNTQKLLTAALVAIMVMTVAWWARYAGTPEMEPLLNQALSDEEVTKITTLLDAHDIEHQVSSDRKVLVAADRKIKTLALLGYADVLPKNTASAFDDIIKQLSPFDPQSKQELMFNHGKETYLSEVIRNFPHVASANVVIDPRLEYRVSGSIEPTAIVNITLKEGMAQDKKLVNAAASVVAGAQAGLAMKNIRVVVNGISQRVKDAQDTDGGGDADSIHEMVEREENRLADKIAKQFGDIQGVMVAVTVKADTSKKSKHSTKIDKLDSAPLTESTNHKESTEAPQAAGEPGVGSNIGPPGQPPAAAVAGAGQSEDENKNTFQPFPTFTEENSTTPAGDMTTVSASVRVPMSYFVRLAKGSSPSEPDSKAVQVVLDKESLRIQGTVQTTLAIKNVDVTSFLDPVPLGPLAGAPSPAAGITVALTGYTKEIVLGVLALISLFMVSTIVKKGAPPPLAPAPVVVPVGPPNVLAAAETIAGEVGGGDPLLDGMELDDDAVRTQQMIEQVSTMVKDNPDSAASLVKRWLNRS